MTVGGAGVSVAGIGVIVAVGSGVSVGRGDVAVGWAVNVVATIVSDRALIVAAESAVGWGAGAGAQAPSRAARIKVSKVFFIGPFQKNFRFCPPRLERQKRKEVYSKKG